MGKIVTVLGFLYRGRLMKRAIFGCAFLIVFSFCLFAHAEDSEFVRIVGERKYSGRDFIVRNPKATPPPPSWIPLAKMDSTQEECEIWTEDKRVSFSEYTTYSPRIAVVGDAIHAVWYEYSESFYKRSVDGGITWEDSSVLSTIDDIESIRPEIVAVHNNIYVVWEDFCSIYQECGIYFRKSTDGGITWQEMIPVALRGVDNYDYYCPTIAVRDSEIYVAYNRNDGLEGSLRFKKSLDSGESWENEVIVSDTPESGHWLKLAMNSVGLHISHEAGLRIYYNRSADWGDTWSDDIFISDMEGSIAQWPSIGADDNGGIYITWFDYKYSPPWWEGDIFLRRSTDNGETWDSIMVLTDNHECIESDVCADRSSVHVVWHDERHNIGNGNVEIYHRRSTNLGLTWEEEDRLTNAPYQSSDPRIIKDRSKLYMIWVENRHEPDPQAVYFKKGYWYIRGDVNRDRVVDIADAVYLINYLFISGPSPDIFESGDVNGDDQIDIADVVYLINYLFISGPEPVGC